MALFKITLRNTGEIDDSIINYLRYLAEKNKTEFLLYGLTQYNPESIQFLNVKEHLLTEFLKELTDIKGTIEVEKTTWRKVKL